MKSIKNLITGIADIIVENLDSGRIIVTGKNGPYNNLETNIRAYSHMLVLLSKAELIDNQKKYVRSILEITDKIYYSSKKGKYNYCFRETGKDESNGLIGISWLLEGIIASYTYISDHPIIDEISNWLNSYVYSKAENLWKNIAEPNNIIEITDFTANHQIWFRASMHKFKILRSDFNSLQKSDLPNSLNLIHLNSEENVNHYPPKFKEKIRKIYYKIFRSNIYKDLIVKERGYHFFNLLGLIRYSNIDEETDNLIRAKLKRINNLKMLDINADVENKYGTPYNPVYLEAAIISDFLKDSKTFNYCMNSYFKQYVEQSFFINDKPSFYSRIYEISYMNNNLNHSIKDKMFTDILNKFQANLWENF
jgi:hypothetical protein